jgi:hypothetical protein
MRWSIVNLEYIKDVDGTANVIKNAHWWCQTEVGGYIGYCWGNQQLDITNPSGFTDYTDVTEEQVIGWVKSAMGEEQVNAIENYTGLMATKSDPMNNRGLGLPWQS